MSALKVRLLTEGGLPDSLTLRDYFAGQALPELIAKVVLRDQATGMPTPVVTEIQQQIARGAYAYADAMLAERAK